MRKRISTPPPPNSHKSEKKNHTKVWVEGARFKKALPTTIVQNSLSMERAKHKNALLG